MEIGKVVTIGSSVCLFIWIGNLHVRVWFRIVKKSPRVRTALNVVHRPIPKQDSANRSENLPWAFEDSDGNYTKDAKATVSYVYETLHEETLSNDFNLCFLVS